MTEDATNTEQSRVADEYPTRAPYDSEHLHNVRRTLERGLRIAQSPPMDGTYLDTFTHALDELKRAGLIFPEP